ncbi:MAG: DedD protein [Gammaproteobacteria bacterium]|jgi:DedD protein
MMHQQVKERVVGAVVLVIAAVIFVPMILAGAPHKSASLEGSLAVQPDAAKASAQTLVERSAAESKVSRFSSRIVPLGETPAARSSTKATALEQARARVKEGEGRPAALDTAAAAKRVPTPALPASTVPKSALKRSVQRTAIVIPTASVPRGSWVIQLGSFSSARNAHALRDRLIGKKHKAFARTTGSGAEVVTRVYVGPEATRERAQQHVANLLSETRLQGIVIRYPK